MAQRLGVSTPTVQRWVDLGYLKAWKTVGGHRRIDAASAERFIAEHGLAAPPVAAPAPAGLRVLVVDDNPDDRDLLTALVEATLPGAVVHTAEGGFEALVAIGRATPDILVTDILMPHMDGLEMLRHLASDRTAGPRAIVVVTALAAEKLGALDELQLPVRVVPKPIDPQRFAAALRARPGTGTAAAASR